MLTRFAQNPIQSFAELFKETRQETIQAEVLLVLFAIGNNIFIFLRLGVVIRQKFFLSSFLVTVDVCIDVEAAKQHLK